MKNELGMNNTKTSRKNRNGRYRSTGWNGQMEAVAFEMKGHGEKLSRTGERLITALLSYPTIEAAAKSAGVSTTTAWRWMKMPEFQTAYREARREAMRQTTARLQEAAAESVDALREIQRAGESESARVSAARTILEQSLKTADLEDVQARLESLEKALTERKITQ
jgi:hypothetical protein